ncbi:hypothetical protein HO173_007021 [Letharia columbiana]|uniref:Uncharacterized protein n=1 Tax=Letharia columbiana TaxID=112416 RepID=A0A8H6FU35_9LECA|nr:uncharacterized protein HO173_007021 [Letharia columbiana]KAF6234801.1 hypothetical protein HO173_007021 [Letharia columbiana]
MTNRTTDSFKPFPVTNTSPSVTLAPPDLNILITLFTLIRTSIILILIITLFAVISTSIILNLIAIGVVVHRNHISPGQLYLAVPSSDQQRHLIFLPTPAPHFLHYCVFDWVAPLSILQRISSSNSNNSTPTPPSSSLIG